MGSFNQKMFMKCLLLFRLVLSPGLQNNLDARNSKLSKEKYKQVSAVNFTNFQ